MNSYCPYCGSNEVYLDENYIYGGYQFICNECGRGFDFTDILEKN